MSEFTLVIILRNGIIIPTALLAWQPVVNMGDFDELLSLPDGSILGRSGGYIEANGTRFYHEIHGQGEPLLLMHGAWATLESLMFQVGPLSERFKVILVERRGHGRTPDTTGRFTYRQGAEDMVAVLDRLGFNRAHLVGWSDGALVGLMMVREHPQIARRFVSISGCYHFRGYTREFARSYDESTPESLNPLIAQLYKRTTPDGPDHFPVVFEKIKEMYASHPRYTKRELDKILTPILVMSGDEDLISLDHTINFFRGLPNSHLSIIPGATHMLPMEKPDLVNSQIIQFLESGGIERGAVGLFTD
jgi:pimeloyl-ACP methyl ester carboxylesterase